MGALKVQYFLLVFIASCGVLQGVFAYRRIRGLQFFPGVAPGMIFAVVATVGAFVWFFSTGLRNELPVVEGKQQFGLFVGGAISALAFTLLVSSLLGCVRRVSARIDDPARTGGLDDLEFRTYVGCIPLIWRDIVSAVRQLGRLTKKGLSSS